MSSLVLYSYWRSSSSYRVRFALAAKGLAFETRTVNLLKGEQGQAEHVHRAPSGHVPCLEIDGRPMIESVAIIELLEDLFPEPALYPKDPWEKARVRSVVELVNAGIQPLQNMKVLARMNDAEMKKQWGAHFNALGLQALEQLLEIYSKEKRPGKHAFGDTLTAADIFIVPQVYSAKRFDVDLAPFPRVVAAATAAMETEAAKSAHPDNQPDAVK
ncbi:MAG TPA: maleylacetoacetate isomerase [Polyangiaceae bacterium]